uniref:Macaca fascicularis brain cDNA clone: QtrA-17688, similar to human general transcription factor IIIA (GTF3A), mRNA, RefSeq: NM_002097.1 n=1 Tax=Macaca fascicularis TaxID=9541 RepID=I7GPK1_MACFA|nr:unnamed protein product [Macaca fascicularis]
MDWLIPHVLPMQVYPGRMWETLCITQQAETTRQDPRGCVRTAWVCSSEGDAKSWVPLNLFRDHADKKGTLWAGDTILLIWVLHSCPRGTVCVCFSTTMSLLFTCNVVFVHKCLGARYTDECADERERHPSCEVCLFHDHAEKTGTL